MYCLGCGCKVELGAKFCAHCGKPTPLANQETTGKINIVRVKKTFAFAITFDVYIDDVKLGTLKNGSSLSCPASFGSHQIVLKSTEKDVVQGITLNENQKEVTIEIVPKMGIIAAKPSIKEIKYN